MKKHFSDKRRHNSNIRIIYLVLVLISIIPIGMSVFPSQYIYPRFEKQLLSNVEREVARIAKHMTLVVLRSYSHGKLVVSDEVENYCRNARINHNLLKIRIFSRSGEIIYSTAQEEIGGINNDSYFQTILSRTRPFSEFLKLDIRNLDDQIVEADVVKSYIPLMIGNLLIGTIGFYQDITLQKRSTDALIFQINLLLYISAIIIFNVVVLAFFIYRDSIKEKNNFEHAILKMANTDELTGLYNRRGFKDLLQWEFRKIERYHRKACILLFDIDHFKKVNDTYGHQAGDTVLEAVAQKCRSLLRKSDILARYGGEEFIVLLSDTHRLGAVKVAEKLRLAIESTPILINGKAVNVTISIGVAYFGDKHVLSIDSVIKYADDSLYIAKMSGRNQIFCAQANSYLERGKNYDRKGQHDKAISEFNKAIEINPKYASAYTERGVAFCNKGRYERGIADYNTAIKINPRLAKAYTNRGVAYGRKEQYEKEFSDYNTAISIGPRYAKAYFDRGAAYGREGEYDKAISDYTMAIEISPRYAEAYLKRSLAYYSRNEYEKAWNDIYKIQDLGHKIGAKCLKMLRKASGKSI